MPVTTLHEIRMLPGVTIARLGSSPSPMDNYSTKADGSDFRDLEPAETLIVNPDSGEITDAVTPQTVRFRDARGRIRPVCPFLELWGRFDEDEDLRPVTNQDLEDLNLSTTDVKWSINLGGLKIFRRTGDPADRIMAILSADQLTSHARMELEGKCPNFKTETTKITMGWVQYIRPTDEFPEIRMRFTPPPGLVYGHRVVKKTIRSRDGSLQEIDIIPSERAIYDPMKGRWDNHSDGDQPNNPTPRARYATSPQEIYARSSRGRQLGYFDDVGDAIISASIENIGVAQARIAVGPPDFAPDSYSTRTVQDEILQITEGAIPSLVSADDVIDIVQRALETLRLMNTELGNSIFVFWRPDVNSPIFDKPEKVEYFSVRDKHERVLANLQGLKAPADSAERKVAHGELALISSMLREFDRAADYDSDNMQRMPAMMRDSSGEMLTLTRRQINSIRVAVEKFKPVLSGPVNPETELETMIISLSWASTLHQGISTAQGVTLDSVFDDPEKVIEYLRNGTAQGADAKQLDILGEPLVVAGDLQASAIIKLVNKSDHAMNAPLSAYQATDGVTSGIGVLSNWISQL